MSEDNQEQNKSVSVVITEADFSDEAVKAEIINRLLEKKDEFERPRLSVVRARLNVFIPLTVWAGLFCALFFTLERHALAISLGVSLGTLGLYILIRMRAILVWFIKLYQRLAPDEVRRRCVFTPTCSQYSFQALERYGVIRGVPKIVSRLCRCHLPNGGDDPLK